MRGPSIITDKELQKLKLDIAEHGLQHTKTVSQELEGGRQLRGEITLP